jgi:hypothetical protein
MWIIAGVVDQLNKKINWWNNGKPSQYNAAGTASAPISLAIASGGANDTLFLVEVHVNHNSYCWMAATVNEVSQTLTWWQNNQSLDEADPKTSGTCLNRSVFLVKE